MIDTMIFIVFLLYTIAIFFIKDYALLLIAVIINILLMILIKVNIKQAAKNLLAIMVFILITAIINIIVVNFNEGILIGLRLIIVCNITFTFSKILSPSKLSTVIENLFRPLHIFKINSKDIAIIISIAISFIPIIKKELTDVLFSLKSNGFNLNTKNIILHVNLIISPVFLSLLKKVNDIENSLKSKTYI